MYKEQNRISLWKNLSHIGMRRKEYVNYKLLYFIIFYAILLHIL